MRLSCSCLALAVCLASPVNAFTSIGSISKRSFLPRYMSDSQPSDSSSEDLLTVTIENEPYTPTETESLVTSVLDELPSSLTSGDVSRETRASINEALLKLEALNPTKSPTMSPLLNGIWELRYSGGYSSDWALASPTRQLALFLYSGGYSPGLFALSLAQKLPAGLIDLGDLEISISREQPRIEAKVPVKFLGGAENEVIVRAKLNVESDVRFSETYESATVLGQTIDLPEQIQYSRQLYVTYADDDMLVVRDSTGVPEVLVRKGMGSEKSWGMSSSADEEDLPATE